LLFQKIIVINLYQKKKEKYNNKQAKPAIGPWRLPNGPNHFPLLQDCPVHLGRRTPSAHSPQDPT